MRNIPVFKLIPEPLSEEAKNLPGFRWAKPGVGNRHKLGGGPDFLQKASVPTCSCKKEMTFYGQLDSINDEFILADCGMIYVFVCFDCYDVRALLQSG